MDRTSYLRFLRSFADCMPAAYHARHDAFAAADHARILFDRRGAPLHAGRFRGTERHGTPVCIVGSSRETIVAAISRAVVLTRFEVGAAEAYTIEEEEAQEFMGLFWVRHQSGAPLDAEELRLLVDLLIGFGNRAVHSTLRLAATGPDARATQVRFLEGLDGNLSVLEVETPVRSGLLSTLVDVLLAQQLEIVHCEVQSAGDRVRDRFRLVERDGASVAPTRWRQLQVHVLDAIANSAELRTPVPMVASA